MENIYRYYVGKKREEKGRENVGFSQEPKKTGSNRPNNFN